MRRRLREYPSPTELAAMYARTYDHTHWVDHQLRIRETIALVRNVARREDSRTAADLSCGDGAIIDSLDGIVPVLTRGDIVPRLGLDYVGPITDTILQLADVDLFICTETIEHVDDPDALLLDIQRKTDVLILSTPDTEAGVHYNPEHIWEWDSAGMKAMLLDAGFFHCELTIIETASYDFQTWICR